MPSFLLLGVGLYAMKQLLMVGLLMFLRVTMLDLDLDLPWQTARSFWTLQTIHVGFLGLALATGQYLESRAVQGVLIIILQALGLAVLRTLTIVVYNHAILYVPIDIDAETLHQVGGIVIDMGFLLVGVALGKRLTRGRRLKA